MLIKFVKNKAVNSFIWAKNIKRFFTQMEQIKTAALLVRKFIIDVNYGTLEVIRVPISNFLTRERFNKWENL